LVPRSAEEARAVFARQRQGSASPASIVAERSDHAVSIVVERSDHGVSRLGHAEPTLELRRVCGHSTRQRRRAARAGSASAAIVRSRPRRRCWPVRLDHAVPQTSHDVLRTRRCFAVDVSSLAVSVAVSSLVVIASRQPCDHSKKKKRAARAAGNTLAAASMGERTDGWMSAKTRDHCSRHDLCAHLRSNGAHSNSHGARPVQLTPPRTASSIDWDEPSTSPDGASRGRRDLCASLCALHSLPPSQALPIDLRNPLAAGISTSPGGVSRGRRDLCRSAHH
jgi:hypothetical protein